jgi:hypothetical protein
MQSKAAPGSPARLLVAIALVGLFAFFGYLAYYTIVGPEPPDTRDYEFYYGQTYFMRKFEDDVFTQANLLRNGNGPWLWISETEGFKVERKNAVEIGKRMAQHLGLEEPKPYNNWVRIEDVGWSLGLVTDDERDRWTDGWVDANFEDAPFKISMTEDGPRLSLRCTEEELVKAFGKPTKIVRNAPSVGRT